ncbi:MAG: rRNA maturation RNase YbeY [Dehalococcoidia bacterium]
MPTASKTREIAVHVFPAFRSSVKAAWVRAAARAALAVGDPDGSGQSSVVIADDETLHDLNRRFRGLDEVTDVLSFGAAGADTTPFPDTPDTRPSLGEVVLSYPLAVQQADEHNVTVEQEVALLIVHGVLHLLGHDHAEPDEEAVMKGLEQKALAQVFQAEASR